MPLTTELQEGVPGDGPDVTSSPTVQEHRVAEKALLHNEGGSVLLGCCLPHHRKDDVQFPSVPLGADVNPQPFLDERQGPLFLSLSSSRARRFNWAKLQAAWILSCKNLLCLGRCLWWPLCLGPLTFLVTLRPLMRPTAMGLPWQKEALFLSVTFQWD